MLGKPVCINDADFDEDKSAADVKVVDSNTPLRMMEHRDFGQYNSPDSNVPGFITRQPTTLEDVMNVPEKRKYTCRADLERYYIDIEGREKLDTFLVPDMEHIKNLIN